MIFNYRLNFDALHLTVTQIERGQESSVQSDIDCVTRKQYLIIIILKEIYSLVLLILILKAPNGHHEMSWKGHQMLSKVHLFSLASMGKK